MAESTTEKARETLNRLKPGESELSPTAKTVAAAVTAALAGGLAAAVKAFVDHGAEDDGAEQHDEEEREEPTAGAEDARDRDRDREDAHEDSGDDSADDGGGDRQMQAPDGGAARIAEAGRNELEQLLGQKVESISGFRRADDGWCVTYEVVELRRIPDSSDVLSSYAVVIDDDGELVGLERKHRYRRSQVDAE